MEWDQTEKSQEEKTKFKQGNMARSKRVIKVKIKVLKK